MTRAYSSTVVSSAKYQKRIRLLLLAAILLVASCGYGAYRLFHGSFAASGGEVTSSGRVVQQLSRDEYESEKTRDLDRVNSLMRRYNRRADEWTRSEERYLEGVHLYRLAYGQLTLSQTPGLFAGEVPSHDERAFDEYVESAEAALEAVDNYVRAFRPEHDENYAALMRARENLTEVVTTEEFPGSGNKMQDARMAMADPAFDRIAAQTDDHISAFSAQNVGPVISSGFGIVMKTLDALFRR